MSAPKVRLVVLRRKTSKAGNEYFTGWLPTCNLLLFRSADDDNEYGEAWVLLAAERDGAGGQQKQHQRRQQPPDDRARRADELNAAASKRAAAGQQQGRRDGREPLPDDLRTAEQ